MTLLATKLKPLQTGAIAIEMPLCERQGIGLVVGQAPMLRYFFAVLFLFASLCQFASAPAQGMVPLVRLDMIDDAQGWAIGDVRGDFVLLKTGDGGRHWAQRLALGPPMDTDSPVPDNIGLSSLNANVCQVAVALTLPDAQSSEVIDVSRTGDGGRHWKRVRLPNAAPGGGIDLQFVDLRHGFLLATSDAAAGMMAKAFYRTSDGGVTWEEVSASNLDRSAKAKPLSIGGYPTGMTFHDARNGWITLSPRGDAAVMVYKTRDGGTTWRPISLAKSLPYQEPNADTYPPQFFGQAGILPADVTWAEGRNVRLVFFQTADGGVHWHYPKPLSIASAPEGLIWSFADAEHGWALNETGTLLYATSDQGKSWKPIPVSRWFSSRRPMETETQIQFLSPRIGWALAHRENTESQTRQETTELLQTPDGGRHWRTLRAPQPLP